MAIGLFDGEDWPDEGLATAGEVVGSAEDTEMLDGKGATFANVEDVGMLEEITERDEVVGSDGDVEVEPFTSISGL